MTDIDPAVELVARTLATTVKRAGLAPIPQLHDALFTGLAEDAVAALAGRLLPPVVQTREEWGVLEFGKIGPPCPGGCSRAWEHTHVRTVSTLADDGSPYGGATVVGRWRSIEGSEG